MREHTDGEFPFANDFNAVVRDALAGSTLVESGCTVSDGGTNDLSLDVASGEVVVNGTHASVGSQSVSLSSADADDPRYDLVVVDSSGTASVVAGTASSTPKAPSIPSDSALLAVVEVPAGASGVTDADIYDARAVLSGIPNSTVTQGSGSGLDADTLDGDDTPLPASAIDDGPGSGLDADTIDGKEASELDGRDVWRDPSGNVVFNVFSSDSTPVSTGTPTFQFSHTPSIVHDRVQVSGSHVSSATVNVNRNGASIASASFPYTYSGTPNTDSNTWGITVDVDGPETYQTIPPTTFLAPDSETSTSIASTGIGGEFQRIKLQGTVNKYGTHKFKVNNNTLNTWTATSASVATTTTGSFTNPTLTWSVHQSGFYDAVLTVDKGIGYYDASVSVDVAKNELIEL